MRFLCLHGKGTNSKIFEMQTAAIRYEIGENHTYDFVEGNIAAKIDSDLSSLGAGNDQGFSYFKENDAPSALAALVNLDNYFDSEGPFDGIIAFSQSVGLAGTWLVHRQRRQLPSVRCGVFFSGAATALDPDILHDGRMVPLPSDRVGQVIDTPTAHIYGSGDSYAAAAKEFSGICNSAVRSMYIHPGRHEVPGSGSGSSTKDVVHLSVNAIRRIISLSTE